MQLLGIVLALVILPALFAVSYLGSWFLMGALAGVLGRVFRNLGLPDFVRKPIGLVVAFLIPLIAAGIAFVVVGFAFLEYADLISR